MSSGFSMRPGVISIAGTRATQYSVHAVIHPVDDDVDFCPLVLDVENILADAIVTGVCCIGPQRGGFGLTPGDRKLGRIPAANAACFMVSSCRTVCQHRRSIGSNPAAICARAHITAAFPVERAPRGFVSFRPKAGTGERSGVTSFIRHSLAGKGKQL